MKSFISLIIMLFVISSTIAQQSETYSVIFKINSQYKSTCNNKSINIEMLNTIFRNFAVNNIIKAFPNHEFNEYRDTKRIDLTTIYKTSLNNINNANKFIHKLKSSPYIKYAELYITPQLMHIPNDPHNTTYQYSLERINAYKGWDIHKGDTSTIIGITDTGIDLNHEDMKGNISYNYNDTLNGIDDDNDGFIDNYRGWDFGCDDSNPQININPNIESRNHGNAVTGIAAASTNNQIGISGVSYKCRYLPIKIANSTGELVNTYESIVYAADHNCKVIVCSWGSKSYSYFAEDVINYATINKNTIIVAAAGNDGNEGLFYPASFNNVISVAATDINDIKWSGSNYNNLIDISAPGSSIYMPLYNNRYTYGWGTSFAAPIVAGCAAITASYYPNYNAQQIAELIKVTADIIDTISDNSPYISKLGYGRVNLFNALTMQPKPVISIENINISTIDEYVSFENPVEIHFDIHQIISQISNTTLFLTTENPHVQFENNELLIDSLSELETWEMSSPIILTFDTDILVNEIIDLKLSSLENIYISHPNISFIANKNYLNISNKNITTTITGNGKLGYNSNNELPEQGKGFIYKDIHNFLYDGGFIIANSSTAVYSSFRGGEDFIPISKPTIVDTSNNLIQITSEYETDLSTNNTLKFKIIQNSYIPQTGSQNYILMEYCIINTGLENIENLNIGLFADFDLINATHNISCFDEINNLAYTYNTDEENYHAGLSIINRDNVNYYAFDNFNGGNGGIDITNGFSNEEKYFTLINNRLEAGETPNGNDVASLLSSSNMFISSNDSITITFIIAAANNLFQLKNAVTEGRDLYFQDILSIKAQKNDIFKILFNSTNKNLKIYSEFEQEYQVYIYNTIGKLIWSEQSRNRNLSKNLEHIPNGIYFISIKSAETEVLEKFIIY